MSGQYKTSRVETESDRNILLATTLGPGVRVWNNFDKKLHMGDGDTPGGVTVGDAAIEESREIAEEKPVATPLVSTAGGAVAGDGGAAPYVIGSMDDASFLTNNPEWGIGTDEKRVLATKECRPQMFRRSSDAANDDTASFARFRDGMLELGQRYGQALQHRLVLDRTYLVTQPGAILEEGASSFAFGFTMEGLTRLCGIRYEPTVAGPMIFNDNTVAGMVMRSMRIEGYGKAGNDVLWASRVIEGQGAAQDMTIDGLYCGGVWGQAMFHLLPDSQNNNSEWKIINSGFYGTSGATPVVLLSEGTDQHLNYWFENTNFANRLRIADLARGGSLVIRDCDFSGHDPQSLSYMVRLGRPGQAHSLGVTSAVISHLRTEQKTIHSKLLECYWPFGHVKIEDCDGSSQYAPERYNEGNILFDSGDAVGVRATITGNSLPGNMIVRRNAPTNGNAGGIFLHQNKFLHAAVPTDFADISGTFGGVRPSVVFSPDNEGGDPPGYNDRTLVHWGCNAGACAAPSTTPGQVALAGSMRGRREWDYKFADQGGGSQPSGSSTISHVPIGAIIRTFRAFLPANPNYPAGNFRVRISNDAGEVVYESAADGNGTYQGGVNFTANIGYHCNTRQRSKLFCELLNTNQFLPIDLDGKYSA